MTHPTLGRRFRRGGWTRAARAMALLLVCTAEQRSSQPLLLSARGLRAEFGVDGASIRTAGNPPVRIRTSTFGRAGSMTAVPKVMPRPTRCTAALAATCQAGVELPTDGLTEWWVRTGDDLEQGWTLAEAPSGAGVLELEVEVDGAGSTEPNGEVRLGRGLRLGPVKAWDARGRDLVAKAEPTDGGFRVLVEDAGAAYPVSIDPLYTAADWSIAGTAGTGTDSTVVALGDLSGDGHPDVSCGRAVFLGSGAGFGSAETILPGVPMALGDVNGDGYDDVLADSAIYYSSSAGAPDTGVAVALPAAIIAPGDFTGDGFADIVSWSWSAPFLTADVYHGSAAGLDTAPSETVAFDAGYSTTFHWASMSAGGDLDGDGTGDLVAAASLMPVWDETLIFGVVWGGDVADPTRGEWPDYGFGITALGDVNGDGRGELIVPFLPDDERLDDPYAFVYTVSPDAGLDYIQTLLNLPDEGRTITALGDLNGDGADDVLIDRTVFLGGRGGVVHSGALTLSGTVVGVGDVDRDGLDDVVTLGNTDREPQGAAWWRPGSASSVLADPVLFGASEDRMGSSLANAGDVDGDGVDDLLLGAEGQNLFRGTVRLYLGAETGLAEEPLSTLTGPASGAFFGSSVDGAGDTNGDGYQDAIVGAWAQDGDGAAYVYLGGPDGLSGTSILPGSADGAEGGSLVAGVGDVDADGFDDVALANGSAEFGVSIHLGSASGASTAEGAWLATDADVDAVDSAGDVNGDGFGDLVVACSVREGGVDIYLGSTSGPAPTATRLAGPADHFGSRAVGAGDIDGDGFDDVAVGESTEGQVDIFFGSESGMAESSSASLRLEGATAFGAGLASGDMNGDGFNDVLVTVQTDDEWTTGVYAFAGSEDGATMDIVARKTGIVPGPELAAGDFNADGLIDVVLADATWNDGGGGASAYSGCPDEDGDGHCDDADCDPTDPEVPFIRFEDADGDGYGESDVVVELCAEVAGFVDDRTDCDDTRADVSPGATEVCDPMNVDEDCDGLSDDHDSDVDGTVAWYDDDDGDDYGEGPVILSCEADGASQGGDCDDDDADVYPGAPESCGRDQNCDGVLVECPDPPTRGSAGSGCGGCTESGAEESGPLAGLVLAAAALARRRPRPRRA